jgi:N-acetylmuramoyl-L-alanine amidase-like protein
MVVLEMATPLNADKMLSALKAEGLKPVEYKEWRTHGRDSATGLTFGPVNGIVIHHTAGSNSRDLVYNGRSDLPGPLAHAHLAKDGTLSLISCHRANHGGYFAQNAHDAVVNESTTHPRPSTTETVDANDHYYGIEIENLGNGSDPYPAVQYEAAVKWAAAICRAHGWSKDSVIGHKEGTTRKIDPSFDMNKFRDDVAARLRGETATTPEEDEVTNEDIKKIAVAVWSLGIDDPLTSDDSKTPTGRSLRGILARADRTEQKVDDLKDSIQAVVRAELKEALKGATVKLTISE